MQVIGEVFREYKRNMGKRDTLTKNYMKRPVIFADFFNGYLYDGEEVIDANTLQEVDTTNIAVVPYTKGNKSLTIQKYRDILKKAILMSSREMYYLFLGIENQSEVHYAMPVRNMLYDALVYHQQIETISKYNRENGLCENEGAFLSGFTKKDKLLPIVTVTVYWGTEPWDAPVTLKGMLENVDSHLDKFINDYNCNLFSIIDAKELPKYRTELNELFQVIKRRNNKEEMYNLVTTNQAYQSLDKDTAIMMREFANIKLPRKNKEGKYNMCKAISDLKQESADNALIEAIRNLMKNTKKTFEDVCQMMGISEDDMNRYKKMI